MSHRELYLPGPPAPRRERVETYLDQQIDTTSQVLEREFWSPEKQMAGTAVMIPVAAHQDGDLIEHTMGEYAKQKECDPFTIFLLLNAPTDAIDSPGFYSGLQSAERARQKFTDTLDIRLAHINYDTPTIGTIRKHLWDAVTRLAIDEDHYENSRGEVIGINHDIDTDYLSPRYISLVQQHYRAQQQSFPLHRRLEPAFSQSSHTYPRSTHPNTAKGLFWSEMTSRQSHRVHGGGYEAGLIVPLSEYATRGGFKTGTRTHETARLAMPQHASELWPREIARTILRTSPRRFIDRFPENGYSIWSDESFGASDNCRASNLNEISRDATRGEVMTHIQTNLNVALNRFCHNAFEKSCKRLFEENIDDVMGAAEQTIREEVERSFRLAEHVLRRTLELPALASQINPVNAEEFIKRGLDHLKENVIVE